MNKTLIVNQNQCREILSVERCMPVMRDTLMAVSENKTKMLKRTIINHQSGNKLANMPASLLNESVTGTKVIIFPGEEAAKNHTNQGIIPLFDIETGAISAIIDAELITVMRTAATSAVATDELALKSADTLAILGAGKQGKAHIKAICSIRNIKKVYVWDMFFQTAELACNELKTELPNCEFIPCNQAEQAVSTADIICTATPGKTEAPILMGEWVKKGAHINAIGACSANGRELDSEIIENGTIFTDWNEAVQRDGGDILIPLKNGELSKMPKLTELGSVLCKKENGRTSSQQITVFESVGISVEDIAAANMIYKFAKENNIGTYIEI